MVLITVLAVAVVCVAVLVEVYKKRIRGKQNEDGKRVTKAKSWEVYAIALALCIPWGIGLWSLSRGGWIMAVLWTTAIYSLQYMVDMHIVKRVVLKWLEG